MPVAYWDIGWLHFSKIEESEGVSYKSFFPVYPQLTIISGVMIWHSDFRNKNIVLSEPDITAPSEQVWGNCGKEKLNKMFGQRRERTCVGSPSYSGIAVNSFSSCGFLEKSEHWALSSPRFIVHCWRKQKVCLPLAWLWGVFHHPPACEVVHHIFPSDSQNLQGFLHCLIKSFFSNELLEV